MSTDARFKITGRQFMFTLIGAAAGSGILSLPRAATKEALQDGWIAVLIGIFAPLLSLLLVERLCKIYPEHSLSEIANKIFGAFIGRIFTLCYIAYTILMVAASLRIFVEITSLYIVPKTPIPVILAVYMIFIVYTIKNGSRLLGRFNELTFFILPVTLFLLLPALSVCKLTNLLPIGEAGLEKILKASLTTAFSYASTELVFVFYPMVKEKERKKVLKYGISALGIMAFTYTSVTVLSTLAFGAETMQGIIWPPILLYKVVDIPIIERLDLFFLILWTAIAVRPSINYSFAASYSFTQILSLKTEKHLTLMSVITGVIIFAITLIPKDIQQVFDLADYVGYGYFIVGIGYPIVFLLASLLMKGRILNNV